MWRRGRRHGVLVRPHRVRPVGRWVVRAGNGRRVEVKRVPTKVTSGVWRSLRAHKRGDHIEIYFNGQKLIDVHDLRFTAPGKVGVWTKADSYTLFGDLTSTPLAP